MTQLIFLIAFISAEQEILKNLQAVDSLSPTHPLHLFLRKKGFFFKKQLQRQSPIVEIAYQLRPRKAINRELLTGNLIQYGFCLTVTKI